MTPQELKNSILQLAIQGKLVEQRAEEGTVPEQYRERMQEHPSMGGMAILSYAAARKNDIMRIVRQRSFAEAEGGYVRRPLTLGRAVMCSDKERTMRHES